MTPGVREVMGSIPVGDSDFFFVRRSCHVDYFIFITLSPSLKFTVIYFIIIYHDDIDNAVPSSMQDACHAWTQFNGVALHEFSWLSG